jgi:uncharacterized protein (TIGR01777 family)
VKAFIAGGTGFVGVNLANSLVAGGHQVTVLGSRPQSRPSSLDPAVDVVIGDGRRPGAWQEGVSRSGLVINLAGASIFSRWTSTRKRLIAESRLLTTMNIVNALQEGSILFSTSAVGYYGFRGDEEICEDDAPGSDFLAVVCRQWEDAAFKAEARGVRVVVTRFGIVLGKGGALAKMLPLFRLGLGGRLGGGDQWFSWIHMEDLMGAMEFLLARESASGPYNLTSPNPVRNSDLAASLGRVLHRPAVLPAPGVMIRLAMGELGNVVLRGQRVIPARLGEAGYTFRYPAIEEALESALNQR